MYIVDRRPQSDGSKSLPNRKRYIEKNASNIKKALRDSVIEKPVSSPDDQYVIKSSDSADINEPIFSHDHNTGHRNKVYAGNREFRRGDEIPKPPRSGGRGGGSSTGGGDDEFTFTLTQEEFYELFLDDLELPNLTKKSPDNLKVPTIERAGLTNQGSPANLRLLRSMRNAVARRIALHRPHKADIRELESRIQSMLDSGYNENDEAVVALKDELDLLRRRSRAISWIDPVDLRYQTFDVKMTPKSKAVMILLMDVSGSMDVHMKGLAKQFFKLLHIFLTHRYDDVEVVFVRHSHEAEEVDEKDFFYDTKSGGTVISKGYEVVNEVINRYPLDTTNIYLAQASDGDNVSSDYDTMMGILTESILPRVQFFIYVEIDTRMGMFNYSNSDTWSRMQTLKSNDVYDMALAKLSKLRDIIPIFRAMFSNESTPELTS